MAGRLSKHLSEVVGTETGSAGHILQRYFCVNAALHQMLHARKLYGRHAAVILQKLPPKISLQLNNCRSASLCDGAHFMPHANSVLMRRALGDILENKRSSMRRHRYPSLVASADLERVMRIQLRSRWRTRASRSQTTGKSRFRVVLQGRCIVIA